jgi:galactonate dehydratase
VKKGYLDLPDRPGFGVELIEKVVKQFACFPRSYAKPNPDLHSQA